jgi:uncharacterized membrane protein YfcA
MVWPLTWIVVFGTLPGVFIGAMARVLYLPDPRHFKLFAACVLFYIGWKMVADVLKNAPKGTRSDSEARFRGMLRSADGDTGDSQTSASPVTRITHWNLKRLGFTFYDETYDVSFWGIFLLSFIVGIVGGIYGIGGGSIIAPFFITFFGLPVYIVAGAALMGTFVTSVAGVAFYQAIAPFYPDLSVAPDWMLGLLFGLGGMAGMYLGARCQKFVPARAIKWMLAGIMVFTAVKYVFDFFG